MRDAGNLKVFADDFAYLEKRFPKADRPKIDSFYLIEGCDQGVDNIALSPTGPLVPADGLVGLFMEEGIPDKPMDFPVWASSSKAQQ